MHRHTGQELEVLKYQADRASKAGQVTPAEVRELSAVNEEPTPSRLLLANQQPNETGFACPGWADQENEVTLRDSETDVIESVCPIGIRLPDVLEADDRPAVELGRYYHLLLRRGV
jgi:hypothetical protein